MGEYYINWHCYGGFTESVSHIGELSIHDDAIFVTAICARAHMYTCTQRVRVT